jgi:hypothetical protein
MLKSILLAVLLLLVFMPSCDYLVYECRAFKDSDCDDGDPCTKDVCNQYAAGTGEGTCDSQWKYLCDYSQLGDGTRCEVDGQSGVCYAGECELDDDGSGGGGGL